MKKQIILFFALLIFVIGGCRHKSDTSSTTKTNVEKMDGELEAIEDSIKYANALALQSKIGRTVSPKAETQPVAQENGVDAADDPAIWYNEENPAESRILGTDKKSGLALYNLQGDLVSFNPVGRVNNVDLRYNYPIDGRTITIAAASERNANGVMLFEVTADSLIALQTEPTRLDSNIIDDAYGCCMYYSRKSDKYYAFVCGKNGNTQQLYISNKDGQVQLTPVRTISLSSQCEGMVADDEEGILYIGEEGKAIWKLNAEEGADTNMTALAHSDSTNVNIAFDIEGLDIYYAGNNQGYLIASIQGNFSYAVFEKEGDNNYLGNFTIKGNNKVDGAEETDGLAVTNMALGDAFPTGLLVVQDGFNTDNGTDKPQNFKLVDWADIAKIYETELTVTPNFMWWIK